MAERPGETDDESRADLSGPTSVLGAAEPLTVGRSPKSGGGGTGGGADGGDGGERPRRKLPKVGAWGILIVVAIVIALALTPAFIAGLKKTPRDRVGISYGGGPFEGAHYQRIVQPGSGLFFNGFSDPLYLYPSDQVNYIISKTPTPGNPKPDSVVAPTQDRVQVTYQVAVYFKLNVDKLRAFHEQLGLRYNASTVKGWNSLIRDTFRQQIENALQETRRVDVAEIFGSADFLVELQDRVQAKLTQRLQDALGDRFFCAPTYHPGGPCGDPTFVIKKVDIPTRVAKAFEDNRTSSIQILTKQNEVAQREAEARAIAALGLSGQEYTLLKAIESGKINFWVLPNNSGVTLTPAEREQLDGTGWGVSRMKLLKSKAKAKSDPDPSTNPSTDPTPAQDDAECPVCGTVVKQFNPAGIKSMEPDRRCPTCTSLERHRTVWLYFQQRTDLFTAPARMLHVAPEPTFAPRLSELPNLSYLTADLDADKAMVQVNLMDIPYPDWYFDVFYESHVLEHVPDDNQAMREIFRVLRPGGWALLLVPIWGARTREDPTVVDPQERERLYGQVDHVRMYGHDGEFERRLVAAGFEVTVDQFAAEMDPVLARRYRLIDTDIIFFCRKPETAGA